MNDERFNRNLHEALRLMARESAPATGWEQRVLDESLGKPRRRIMWWVSLSAAAVALALLIPTTPEPATIAPTPTEPALLIAQAPAPYVHAKPAKPAQPCKPIAKMASQQPVVILPAPLAEEEVTDAPEEMLQDVAEYIDELLALNLADEQELISSILDY